MPGSGCVQEPGLVAVTPGTGEIMIAPVSVCHQVSTIGQRSCRCAVVPHPRFRVDRLTDAAEQPQLRQVVLRRDVVAELHQRADRRRRGVEDRHAVLLADLPEAAAIGEGRRAFVHHQRRAGSERAVADVAVAGDPADVGGAPEDVVVLDVEHPLGRQLGAQQVTRARVLDALGLAGGAGGIEQEQWMLRVDPFRIASRRLACDQVVPPDVAALDHRHLVPRALQHDHGLDGLAAHRQRLVGRGLELDLVPAAPAGVGGDQAARAGVLDAVLQRQRREATEHHRVDRADARAGLHRDHGLRHHRHVDDHAVAPAHALRLERVGEATDVGMQFAVADLARVARLALEQDRGAVAVLGEVHVEAVERDVQPAVGEPAVVRRLRVVEPHGEHLLPVDLGTRQLAPIADRVGRGTTVQCLEILGLQPRARGERLARRERALFEQYRLDVLVRHWKPLGAMPSCRARG